MITEQALQEAIAEVQGKRDPNRQDCMMLAAFYIIQDRLYPPDTLEADSGYSYAPEPKTAEPYEYTQRGDTVGDHGDSEFLQMICGMDAERCWTVMDELMTTLHAINPRLYAGVLRELQF